MDGSHSHQYTHNFIFANVCQTTSGTLFTIHCEQVEDFGRRPCCKQFFVKPPLLPSSTSTVERGRRHTFSYAWYLCSCRSSFTARTRCCVLRSFLRPFLRHAHAVYLCGCVCASLSPCLCTSVYVLACACVCSRALLIGALRLHHGTVCDDGPWPMSIGGGGAPQLARVRRGVHSSGQRARRVRHQQRLR